MKVYAVIDTNVIVAALLSKHDDSATVQIINMMMEGTIIPLYHQEILTEYYEVLSRTKFHVQQKTIEAFIKSVIYLGVEVFPQPSGEILADMDDLIFYEVTLEKRDDNAYLVTGNKKHYPIRNYIVDAHIKSQFL